MATRDLTQTVLLVGDPVAPTAVAGLDFGNISNVSNMLDPTSPQEAATKSYVDSTGGDFSGPPSAVSGNFVSFSGTTGKLGVDSGVSPSDIPNPFVSPVVLQSASALAAQEPSGFDTAGSIFVQFGPPQVTTEITTVIQGGDIEASIIRFNESGHSYFTNMTLGTGRTTATGNANLAIQIFYNGVPLSIGIFIVRLANANEVEAFPLPPTIVTPTAGDEITVKLYRSSANAGNDNGGLYPLDLTATLTDTAIRASAATLIRRLGD